MTDTTFNALPLSPSFLKNLTELGYMTMTEVQAQSLPSLLQGKDLIVKAKTGSGKTVAFGISVLNRVTISHSAVQGLILCPTRELADQVARELRKLARQTPNLKILTLCGGMPFGPQLSSLSHAPHIIVATPGRLQEHLRKGSVSLNQVNTLVLDEADRMLDMGFLPSITEIIEKTGRQRQTLLFSATYPDSIREISEKFQQSPNEISVTAIHQTNSLNQLFIKTENNNREELLFKLLAHHKPARCVIFCNTKRSAQQVAEKLQEKGHFALALHGDLEQWQRDQTTLRFANGSCPIIVATDVAARGLDIEGVELVVNCEISRDPEVYVHRIGRTGRAGEQGLALSLFSADEQYKLDAIADYQQLPCKLDSIPDSPEANLFQLRPSMTTLQIDGGRKQKIRPGDLLGALTGEGGIAGNQVGKIHIFDRCAYVAVSCAQTNKALKKLATGKIKGKNFRVRKIR